MPTQIPSQFDARVTNTSVRHNYRVLTDEEKSKMVLVKDIGLDFLNLMDALGTTREYSLAKTKIEEAVMWAVKGLTK